MNQALLCYKKAISLQPPKEQLGVILLNKASLELSIGERTYLSIAPHLAAITLLQLVPCCRRLHTGIEGP